MHLALTGCQRDPSPPNPSPTHKALRVQPTSQPTSPASARIRQLVFSSARAAISRLLDTVKPRIVAFGEVHEKKGSRPVRSAIWRFGHEILDSIAEPGSHLLVETWITKGQCGKVEKRAVRKVETTTKRPQQTESEIVTLIKRAKKRGVTPHILRLSCDDYRALLDDKGKLDPVKLLGIVTRLMQRDAEKLLAGLEGSSRLLIYGGALHNDLFPRKELAPFAFGGALRRAAKGRYLEVDLYVPEYVEGDAELKKKAWYPLLKTLRRDQVILFERGEGSYVLLMRRGALARPLDKE
ncbi:MAG: hypothetical protein JRH20_30205 [Deltaproteobacteria bacterium]|nr:hypothetical protein [Deltaproteobacteria bacterium]